MLETRRSFLTGIAASLAAPAIVRAGSLMPIRAPKIMSWSEKELFALLRQQPLYYDGCHYWISGTNKILRWSVDSVSIADAVA